MGLLGKKKQQYKFCPVCGAQLKIEDAYCIRCGYSFDARKKKTRKAIKWRNILIVLLLLAAAYFGLRYYNGQSLIPSSVADALNFASNSSIK